LLKKGNSLILIFGQHNSLLDEKLDSLMNAIPENSTCIRIISGKRETWRVAALDGVYYVKISYQKSLFRKLLSLFKISKTDREIRAFQTLKGMNVLVPDLVAHKTVSGIMLPKEDYIVTKEVKGSKRLKDFYLNDFFSLSHKDKIKLICDFSNYIRTLHDKGIMHTDPNLGNFLIRQENGVNRFYLLDLGDVKIKPSVTIEERLTNLSLLNLNFYRRIPKNLRFYFFKNYMNGLISKKSDILKAINQIESMTIEFAKKTWGKRIYWCLGNNSFFDSIKKASLKIHFNRKWKDNEGFKRLLNFPDQYLDEGKGEILKNGRTVKAASVDIGDSKRLFLKRFNRKDFLHTFKNVFRFSRAKRVWMNSYGFELRGLPIPQPIAYMEDRRFRILRRSYVISEFIQDAHTMSSLFKDSAITLEDRLSIMKLVGSEIGRMHMLGCLHGDLKWSNILIRRTNGKYECFFTDLDGSKIKKKLSFSHIFNELARFYREMLNYKLCLAEEEAFFRAYHRNCSHEISYDSMVSKVRK
jgi:tRNA A-37 threonylcarbamoyl transferase component Bud32